MDNLISVIVPIYNTKEYLVQCINSILTQSYRNLEVLLIDDGSTDGSAEVCDQFAKKDNRVRVWHRENSGVSASRNFALKLAKGDWVSFVDSDDWLSDSMYEVLLNLQHKSLATTVCCGVWKCKGNHQEVARTWRKFSDKECVYSKKDALGEILEQSGTLWNKLLKADIAKEIQFDALEYGEDLLYLAHYLTMADDVAVTKTPCYYYRQTRKGNVVSAELNSRHLDYFKATEKLMNLLCEYSEEYVAVERCVDTIVRVLNLVPIGDALGGNAYVDTAKKISFLAKPIEKEAYFDKSGVRIYLKKMMLLLARNSGILSVMYAKLFFKFSKK